MHRSAYNISSGCFSDKSFVAKHYVYHQLPHSDTHIEVVVRKIRLGVVVPSLLLTGPENIINVNAYY